MLRCTTGLDSPPPAIDELRGQFLASLHVPLLFKYESLRSWQGYDRLNLHQSALSFHSSRPFQHANGRRTDALAHDGAAPKSGIIRYKRLKR
eukprot:768388-Hanusia_phi.AAC.7